MIKSLDEIVEIAARGPSRALVAPRSPRRHVPPGPADAATRTAPIAALAALRHDIDALLGAARARARLLGRARQVAEDRRDALRAERRQADDAGVEHEDRDAGGRRREARLGLSRTRRGSLAAGPIDDGTLQRRPRRRRHRRSEPRGRRRHGRPRVRRLGRAAEAARHPRRSPAASIGDDNAFDEATLGFGWSWDDLPTEDYAAGVGALQFNENAVRVTVSPGPSAGDSAGVSLVGRHGSGLTIVSARDDRRGRQPRRRSARAACPAARRSSCAARLPLGADAVDAARCRSTTRRCSSSPRFAPRSSRNGIDVRGPAVDIDDVRDAPARIARHAARRVPVAAAVDAGDAADEDQPEPVRRDVPEDARGGARASSPTAAAGWTAALAIFERWGVPAGRADPARRLGAVALRLRHARGARHDPHARRSRRAAARAVRGVAADRRPRRHAVEPDEGHAGGRQRAREDRIDDQRARRCPATSRRPTASRSSSRSSPTTSTRPPPPSTRPPTPSSSASRSSDARP